MADDRYGGPRRRSSIFNDDDRGSFGGVGGFFERAGDELRSWFGDDDDGRGRGGSGGGFNRQSNRSTYGGRPGGHGDFGGEHYRPSNWRGSDVGGSGGQEGGEQRTGRPQSGTSHFDENYRRWRDEQIAQMDREYEEYCREKQQHFENDFHSWRSSRQNAGQGSGGGVASGAAAAPDGGSALFSADNAGATTTGAGDASASTSSTGSSPTFPKE